MRLEGTPQVVTELPIIGVGQVLQRRLQPCRYAKVVSLGLLVIACVIESDPKLCFDEIAAWYN